MNQMSKADEGGLAIGKFPGIEAKLINMSRRVREADFKKEAKDVERMANVITAISEVAIHKKPTKKSGKKDPKDWETWAKEMRENSIALSDAASKKDAKAAGEAAKKLYGSCTSCHGVFKE
jgi:hypothetical protein